MRKKLFSLFVLLYIAVISISAQNISFRASAPSSVAANQQFRITFTLETSGERGNDIRVPDVSGLQQLYGPSIQQGMRSETQIVNNNATSFTIASTSYVYTYIATEKGAYTIPAATIKVGNSTYKSNELTIEVIESGQAIPRGNTQDNNQRQTPKASVSADDIFIRMVTEKKSVYENEGFLVTFKLYSRVSSIQFTDIQFPNFDGFIAQEIELPQNAQWTTDTYNGRQYYTAILKQTILYPIKSGELAIASGKYEVEISQRVATNSTSFFDPMFKTEVTKRTLTTAGTSINVQALPPGKPVSFTGAVGDYTMKTTVSPEQLKTDEVVSVKVNISGAGNIKFVKNPTVKFPNDFDSLDPKVDESSKVSQSGVTGNKSIEYYGIPRYAGTFTIPNIEFSYFDLKSKSYKTISSGDYTIKVEQGENNSSTTTSIVSSNKEDVRYLGQDIRHIKTGDISFQKGNYLWGSLTYWLWYIIPALLFIIFFIINRQKAAQNSNIALMRTKKANKVATKRLKLANKYLKENNKDLFYEEISKAVWGYLSDKLNIPAAELTKENIETKLTDKEVDSNLISQFINILNTAEFARFAPSGGHDTMGDLYRSTGNVIDKMEATIKK